MPKGRILIVDDEENIRLLLSEELADEGYEVETAANGDECLEKFDKKKFDLVVLDIEMPGKNGIEVAGQLRKDQPGLKIVLLTAYSHYKYDLASWAADAYVVKSADLTELKHTIEELLKL
ncbi:response regulator [Pseudothermotoga sp.]|uniref:response regulator n=1 Tax=Pseudothermotoga sp. TaxID=2033661 RepID=UPI0031F64899